MRGVGEMTGRTSKRGMLETQRKKGNNFWWKGGNLERK
jgi:hypothetical protein